MNNTLKKLMMALALCGALITAAQAGSQPIGTRASRAMREPSGTTLAAPKGGAPTKGKPPAAQPAKTHAPAKHVAQEPARNRGHVATTPARGHGHVEPTRPAHKHGVAKHTPPPPPKHHEPKHHHDHRCDHHCDHHKDNWCVLGASVIGGLVGSLISAAL